MKVAINKKYKYITLEEHCPEDEVFEDWVMQEKFETHSIINLTEDIEKDNLRFEQFDYDELKDTFTFNADKYNAYLKLLNKPQPLTEEEQRILDLELAMAAILGGGM